MDVTVTYPPVRSYICEKSKKGVYPSPLPVEMAVQSGSMLIRSAMKAPLAVQSSPFPIQPAMPATKACFTAVTPYSSSCNRTPRRSWTEEEAVHFFTTRRSGSRAWGVGVFALDRNNNSSSSSSSNNDANKKPSSVPNSNYVVPLDTSSSITRPLGEILRDLNKRIPNNIIKTVDASTTFIPWYHANRMLSFYAPGWCGEIRDVISSDNGSVTVVYRVTIRGSDGEAHRESTGTVSSGNGHILDAVAAAEEIAFCRACARFGLGLYLYHEE